MTNYFEIENIDAGIRELKVEDPELLRAKALADKGQMQGTSAHPMPHLAHTRAGTQLSSSLAACPFATAAYMCVCALSEAVAIWAHLAKGGQPDACCMLGRCYEAGKGVPLDLDKAFDL